MSMLHKALLVLSAYNYGMFRRPISVVYSSTLYFRRKHSLLLLTRPYIYAIDVASFIGKFILSLVINFYVVENVCTNSIIHN